MDEQDLCRGYERRKNLGKIVGERKYQSRANKDVEKKLISLSKRINDLQHQRRFMYKNSVKVKKSVHNQVNQIIKCFQARERNLLSDVDEAFMAQDSSITEELSKLLSTRTHCQTLYGNIEEFKEHLDVITKINNILSAINYEKLAIKPLEFTSNFEQMKVEATSYGCLDGDFVKRFDATCAQDAAGCTPDFLPRTLPDNVVSEQQFKTLQSCFQKVTPLPEKVHKRERTSSVDSFEIIDLLENIHCYEDKDSPMGERDSSPKRMDVCLTKEESGSNNALESLEKYCEVSKSVKFPDIQRRISEMQQQLENLVTSDADEKTLLQDIEDESWLVKSSRRIDALDMDKKNSYCSRNDKTTPADLIKKAFSPYFVNENVESWLSKN